MKLNNVHGVTITVATFAHCGARGKALSSILQCVHGTTTYHCCGMDYFTYLMILLWWLHLIMHRT